MPYLKDKLHADVVHLLHRDPDLFGSGRVIGKNLVLTARHVVTPSGTTEPLKGGWQVRLFSDCPDPPDIDKWMPIEASLKWVGQGNLDLALLELHPKSTLCIPQFGLRIGRIDEAQERRVIGLGFPRGAKVNNQRELLSPFGTLSDASGQTLGFGPAPAYKPQAPAEDWPGFSGGAVLLQESPDPEVIWVYGVVQQVTEKNFNGLLAVARLAKAWEDEGFRRALEDAGISLAPPTDPMRRKESAGVIDFTRERSRHGTVLGRDAVFTTVEAWVDGSPTGWVLIKGGAGTGKSAILTALLERLEKKHGRGSVLHHFLRRGQANWSEPEAILRNLNARLEALVKPDGLVDTQGLERFQGLLAQAAEQSPSESHRLILVIDGLDEAGAAASDTGLLRRFLPTYLPDGVWCVCSSRPNYPELGWLEQRSGLHTIDLDQAPWLEDNQRVVEAYWRNNGHKLQPPLDLDLLEAAIQASQGNILHAVTLRDAFDANPQFRDPNRLPIGFAALLEDMWLKLVEMEDRHTSRHVIDGLGLLATAGEALPLSTVASLLGWDHPADIANFKRFALQFLLEEHADWHGGEARYRPFHEATREFLTTGDHMSPEGRRKNHSLLAEGLASWPPHEDADAFKKEYAARYALLHLSAAGSWGRVSDLLGDLRYCVVALEALGPQLLLTRILDASSHDKPPELAERATIHARVLRLESQWLETYPEELPSLIHNRLICLGWSRAKIQTSFSDFNRGWGLINAVDVGNEICIFRGHTSKVSTCDLDARGRYGVSGGWDGIVRLWDIRRGTNLHVLRPDPQAVRCDVTSCALSASGRYIATASMLIRLEPRREYAKVQVWDAHDGHTLVDLDYESAEEIKVAFAGRDRAIACHVSGRVEILDIEENTTTNLDLGERITGGIAIDPSGLLLAAVTNKGCTVRSLNHAGKLFADISLPGAQLCSFSPDGQLLVIAMRGCAIVASSADGSILHQTKAIDEIVQCRLLPNLRLLYTSGWDCKLVVLDIEKERVVERYEGHTYTVDSCACTPDGQFALTGGGDNTVRLWSLNERVTSKQADRHEKLVYGCAVNIEGTLACSAPQDAVPVLWDARTGKRMRPINANVSYGNLRFCRPGSGDLRLATLGATLQVWDPGSGQLEQTFEIPVDPSLGGVRFVDDIAFARSDLFPLLRTDSYLLVWRNRENLQAIDIPKEAAVCRLDGGRAVATLSTEGKLEIVNLEGTTSRAIIAEGVRRCVGSPKSYAVYALMPKNWLCRLDARSGEVQAKLGEISQEHVSLFVDGREQALWALCYDGGLALQAPTNEVLMAFPLDGSGRFEAIKVPGHSVFGTDFLPNGQLVTVGWDATIRVWDAGQSAAIAAVSGSAPFRCVGVADDRIVAGDQKGNVWFLAPLGDLYPSH